MAELTPFILSSIFANLTMNAKENNPTRKYIGIAGIVIVIVVIFAWNNFPPHQAIGEWRRELCIGKQNFKEDLIIFKDSTAIYWLTEHGNCKVSPDSHIVCSEDRPWGKEGCDWSAKSNSLIVLRCHMNGTVDNHRTFNLVSSDHGLLDDKNMSRVTTVKTIDLFQVPPVCD